MSDAQPTAGKAQPKAGRAGPVANPAGYSGTPLPKKLGIKEDSRVLLVGAPTGFEGLLGELPPRAVVTRRAGGAAGKSAPDITLLFVTSRAELTKSGVPIAERIVQARAGVLWICWPKKASGVKTDVTEGTLREVLLPVGVVDIKVCAVDATWSGLKFTARKES